MSLSGKFSHVTVIRIYDTIIQWELVLYFMHIMSVVINQKQKAKYQHKRKMCQRKIEFCTQILICLKPSLIHVHLRNDSMVI